MNLPVTPVRGDLSLYVIGTNELKHTYWVDMFNFYKVSERKKVTPKAPGHHHSPFDQLNPKMSIFILITSFY